MSEQLRRRLFEQLDAIPLIDPHSHINALDPASHTLADILGYHYFTELAHSAGMPKERIEEPGISPREKVRRLVGGLGPIENTVQYSWFIELSQSLFGVTEERITPDNWETFYVAAEQRMSQPDWSEQVLRQSRLEGVFLTNDFDDPLDGFDTSVYLPCLRTDDLVFHLGKAEVRERLERASGVSVADAASLRQAVGVLFEHFVGCGARACAISLPPDFAPAPVTAARADTAIAALLSQGDEAAESQRRAAANFVFWTLAEFCAEYRLPFDLMIGVIRGVYAEGVHQGRDLYDSRVSLAQYRELLNAFPQVTFPISVLASVTNQELVDYAWIFPNVVTSGHWWYSNTPALIEHDLACRLEAAPATKQIGYYSDMYKLEFGLPKFAMYKRVLAKVLAERFVIDRGWSEERAFALGRQVLRENVDRIFGVGDEAESWAEEMRSLAAHRAAETNARQAAAAAAAAAAIAVGAPPEEAAAEEDGMAAADEESTADEDAEAVESIAPPSVEAADEAAFDWEVGEAADESVPAVPGAADEQPEALDDLDLVEESDAAPDEIVSANEEGDTPRAQSEEAAADDWWFSSRGLNKPSDASDEVEEVVEDAEIEMPADDETDEDDRDEFRIIP